MAICVSREYGHVRLISRNFSIKEVIHRCYMSGPIGRQLSSDLTSRYLCYLLNTYSSLSGGIKYSAINGQNVKLYG